MDNFYRISDNNLLYQTQSILNYNQNTNINKQKNTKKTNNYKAKNYSTKISIKKK